MTARFGRKDLPEETNGNLYKTSREFPWCCRTGFGKEPRGLCCHEAGNHGDPFGNLAVRCPEAVFLVKRTDGREHYKSRWVAD